MYKNKYNNTTQIGRPCDLLYILGASGIASTIYGKIYGNYINYFVITLVILIISIPILIRHFFYMKKNNKRK